MKKLIIIITILSSLALADLIPSGTYSVGVEVEGNTVRRVQWDNGGCMTMFGAVLDKDGYAYGENRRGQSIEIQVDREELR